MRIFDETRIVETTIEGITYRDEDGKRQFIDFSVCHQNYLKRWSDPVYLREIKEMNNMDEERLEHFVRRIKQRKEIGSRNVLEPPWADGPFMEFYTEPPIRFRFTNKGEYASVRNAIEKAGWQTFDHS